MFQNSLVTLDFQGERLVFFESFLSKKLNYSST